MEGDRVTFVDVRPPFVGELMPGRSEVRIGVELDGSRWILRDGRDEILAFGLSEVYFGGVVPKTIMIDGANATAQRVVAGRTADQCGEDLYMEVRSRMRRIRDLAGIVCLDLVMQNRDRHGNNWLLTDEGGLAAVDNEQGTQGPISLRQALRPAWRCLMVDDPDFTPALVASVHSMLDAFRLDAEEPSLTIVNGGIAACKDWRHELSFHQRGAM